MVRATADAGGRPVTSGTTSGSWGASPVQLRRAVPQQPWQLTQGGDGRLTAALDPQDQGPQDACGVFGVWAPGRTSPS